jgi:hypothetical protein
MPTCVGFSTDTPVSPYEDFLGRSREDSALKRASPCGLGLLVRRICQPLTPCLWDCHFRSASLQKDRRPSASSNPTEVVQEY